MYPAGDEDEPTPPLAGSTDIAHAIAQARQDVADGRVTRQFATDGEFQAFLEGVAWHAQRSAVPWE